MCAATYLSPLWAVVAITVLMPIVNAKYNLPVSLPGRLCSSSSRGIEIDGALITSSSNQLYANSACIMRFKADDDHFTSKKFMIHFEQFNITDCTTELKLYFDRDTYGSPAVSLSCNSPRPPVLYTSGKYLTIRLDQRGRLGYYFRIVVTTYKSTSYCKELRCANGYCIDEKLYCDRVDHCFDGSDERCSGSGQGSGGIHTHHSRRRFPMSKGLEVAALLILFVISAVVVVCLVIKRRRRKTTDDAQDSKGTEAKRVP